MSRSVLQILAVACAVGSLAACGEPYTTETTNRYEVPEGLEDCQIYFMAQDSLNSMNVVRCPNSDTTTKTLAKGGQTAAVIEERPLAGMHEKEMLQQLENYQYTLKEMERKVKEIENELEHRAATQH